MLRLSQIELLNEIHTMKRKYLNGWLKNLKVQKSADFPISQLLVNRDDVV